MLDLFGGTYRSFSYRNWDTIFIYAAACAGIVYLRIFDLADGPAM
jgi:hypothetical protein